MYSQNFPSTRCEPDNPSKTTPLIFKILQDVESFQVGLASLSKLQALHIVNESSLYFDEKDHCKNDRGERIKWEYGVQGRVYDFSRGLLNAVMAATRSMRNLRTLELVDEFSNVTLPWWLLNLHNMFTICQSKLLNILTSSSILQFLCRHASHLCYVSNQIAKNHTKNRAHVYFSYSSFKTFKILTMRSPFCNVFESAKSAAVLYVLLSVDC